MQKNRSPFYLGMFLGLFVWVVDAFVDYLFFYEGTTLLGILFFDIPAHEIYMRSFCCICFLIFGYVISVYFGQSEKAKVALKESEEKFRNFTEQSLVGIYLIRDDVFIYVNPKFAEIFGYTVEECLDNMRFDGLVYPEDLATVKEHVRRRAAGELKAVQYRFRGIKKNGEIIHVEIFGSSFIFKGSIAVTGTILDITDRIRAVEALQQSEAFTKATLDNLPVGIAINSVDPAVKFEYMNDNFPKYYRTSREALADPDAFWDAVYEDPEFRKEIKERVLDDCADGDPERMYWVGVPITRKADDTYFITARNIPIPDKQLMISIVWDVTEQKRGEEKLRRQQLLLKKAQKIGNIGSWELDIKKNELIWTDETYRIFRLPIGQELSYETFLSCVHPDDREYVDTEWKAAFNKKPYDIEHRLLIDDKVIWVREKAEFEFNEKDECIRGTGLVQDITELKRAEEERLKLQDQLAQAQKIESIGNLAGGIAHDFNNILFPIVGMSEMLLEDLPAGSLEHENAQVILDAGKRGGDLVKQILAFSRQTEHKVIPVRIQQILKEVLKLGRSTIPTDIEIAQDIQADCGMVMADPTQLHQIAMNLITNAYHAIEQTSGIISVQLKETILGREGLADSLLEPGRYALLSVSDTGCGIDPPLMKKIFDPYFTTKEQGKGTGLGLAVVYGIVKEHHGDIKVYSELGEGTTFKVYLPLMEKFSEAVFVGKVKRDETGTERILLVDDEEPVAKLEKQMLERLGYRVTSRINSVAALEVFGAKPAAFDLVVTDMTMPNMTGNQLARELISIRPDIPIIICTGFSERISKEKAPDFGIKGFLMKPVVKSEMAKMVRKVLDEAKG
jgi:PAS domain S-box-containing protein